MKEPKYLGENLINSKRFSEVKWIARIALDPKKYYTVSEAEKIIETCKKIKRER